MINKLTLLCFVFCGVLFSCDSYKEPSGKAMFPDSVHSYVETKKSPVKLTRLNLSEDSIFNHNITDEVQERLDVLYSFSLREQEQEQDTFDQRYFIRYFGGYITNSRLCVYDEIPCDLKYTRRLIDSLASDEFIFKIFNQSRQELKIFFLVLPQEAQDAIIVTINENIDYFSNYDIKQAEIHYLNCVNYSDSVRRVYNAPETWQSNDYWLKKVKPNHNLDFIETNSKQERRVEYKFQAQLERLIFKPKVMTPKRIIYWLSVIRTYLTKQI